MMQRRGRAGGRGTERAPRRRWTVAAAIALIAASPYPAARAEVSVTTEANMALEYNDNIRLATEAAQATMGRYASAGADLSIAGPQQEFRLHPSVRAQRYSETPVLDNDDYFLDLSLDRELERSTLRLQGNYYRDTTLANDLDTTGLVEIGVRRERSGVTPGLTLELTPQSRLDLDLGYDRVVYGKDTLFGATIDYDYDSGSLGYTRELGEDDRLSLTWSASRLDAPDISNRTYHQDVQLDYATALTDTLHAVATLGVQRSRFAQGARPVQEDTGGLIGFRLNGEWEYHTLDLALTRTVEPSGTGTLMQSDDLSVALVTDLTDRLSANLNLLLSDRTDLQGIDANAERVLGQLQLGLNWTMSESWFLSTMYRYTRQRYEHGTLEADSGAVILALNYGGDRAVLRQ
jgi:hypothetical protein